MTLKKKLNTLTLSAMLTAMSVVVGIFCKNFMNFGGGLFRITFENLPVIASGFIFGPIVGGIVGIICDLVSCLVAPQPSINPFITLGTGVVGALAGIIFKYAFRSQKKLLPILTSCLFAHFVGSVIIKTFGFYFYYSYPFFANPLFFSAFYGII